MQRISLSDAKRISELRSSLGDRTFRQLLTQENSRLIRPERLRNLEAGRGKLSERESRQLADIAANRTKIKQLKARGSGKREFQTNRAIRTWLNNGKGKGQPVSELDPDDKARVIRALWFLGVDPNDGTFYVTRG